MTFLNPAVLFGLIAASIPILIHLLNLRKLKRVEFSSLVFLKELQKNKIRKIKIKQWLLLVIRTLIIIFLVMAFARPALKGISLGGITSSAKTSAVIIIDDTFSMSVIKNEGSLFNQAKKYAEEILTQLNEGDDVAVIKVSGSGNNDNILLSKDLNFAAETVRKMEISAVSGDLHNALVKAASLLASSNNYNKEIYILSDFQKQRLTDEKNLPDLGSVLSEKVRIYTIRPVISAPQNASVEFIKIISALFEKGKPVEVEGIIKNHSAQPMNNLTASLFINGERVSQKSLSLEGGVSEKVIFEGMINKTGYQDIFIEIDDDAISEDNRRYECINIPEKINILLISEDQAVAEYVKLALAVANTGKMLNIDELSTDRASSSDFKKYSTIILIGSRGFTASNELLGFIAGGGSLLFFPGKSDTPESFSRLFAPVTQFRELNKVTATSSAFGSIDFLHPILSELFVSKDKSKIESPVINTYFRFYLTNGYPVIKLNDGSYFLSEYKSGKGKVLIYNLTPVTESSDFPLKSIFVPLIYKSVMYLSASLREEQITAGMPIFINDYSSKMITLQRRGQPDEIINFSEKSIGNRSYPGTNFLSNYFFRNKSGIFLAVPVNHDPRESSAEYLSGKEIKDYFKKLNATSGLYELKWGESLTTALNNLRFGTELWKLFVILALAFLIAEMIIARTNKKDLEHFNGLN